MGFMSRIFGGKTEGDPELEKAQARAAQARADARGDNPDVPVERQGIDGEYDQSGLAKRVALALDASDLEDTETIWVAQHDTTVVFKGSASQEVLDQMAEIARGVNGCSDVDTQAVTVED